MTGRKNFILKEEKMKKCFVLCSAVLILLTMTLGMAVAQGSYPSKPIKLLVTYPAGGGTDLFVRAVQGKAEEILGQPLIIEYKTGLSGAIALAQLKDIKPDGYTICVVNNTGISHITNLIKVPYNPVRDFDYINLLLYNPHAITVPIDSPWNTLADFVKSARESKEGINFGSSGVGSTGHLSMGIFSRVAKIKLNHVPMAGGAGATTAILGGHIPMVVVANQDEYVTSKRLKLLAYVTSTRHNAFPQVPSLRELGYNVDVQIWFGFVGPKGMPKEVVEKLDNAFYKATLDPVAAKNIEKLGVKLAHVNGQALQDLVEKEVKDNGEEIRLMGLNKEFEQEEAKKKIKSKN
jgi:tripartite-type tricarboxylate transporter receptor subunit TctC